MESMQGSQLMFFGRRKNVESLWSRKPHRCLGDCESELVLLISFLVPTLALVEWQSIVTNPNQPLLKHPSQQGGYFETILCIGRDWCEHCDIVDHLGLGQLRGSALDWLHAACCFSLPSVPSLLPPPSTATQPHFSLLALAPSVLYICAHLNINKISPQNTTASLVLICLLLGVNDL